MFLKENTTLLFLFRRITTRRTTKAHFLQIRRIRRRLAPQRFGPQQGHFHRRLAPIDSMIAVTGRPRNNLRLRLARQDPKDDRRRQLQAGIQEPLGDGIGNEFKMHGIALDEHTGGDNGIDRSTEGQKARREGQFKGSGDGCFENVGVVDLAFFQAFLNARHEIGHVVVVPAGADNANAHLGAVQFRKGDFGFCGLMVVCINSSENIEVRKVRYLRKATSILLE
jgi:hypothetical protein